MINGRADEVIDKPFELLFIRSHIGLDILMGGDDFIFGCVHLLHYKFRKTNFKRG